MASPEATAIIASIIKAKTLYERLGVNKVATKAEIRTAFKKRTLLVHPDRCKHPKAEEAFKLIAEAFEILSDEKKRKEYDNGPSSQQRPHLHHPQYTYTAGSPFDSHTEIPEDVEELLRELFRRNGYGSTDVHFMGSREAFEETYARFRRRQQRQSEWRQTAARRGYALSATQLIVSVLLCVMAFLFSPYSTTTSSAPVDYSELYAFVKSAEFPREHVTRNLGVSYYTGDAFQRTIRTPWQLREVEDEVEMRTVLYLGEMCDGDFDSGLIECEELKRLLRNGHPLTRLRSPSIDKFLNSKSSCASACRDSLHHCRSVCTALGGSGKLQQTCRARCYAQQYVCATDCENRWKVPFRL